MRAKSIVLGSLAGLTLLAANAPFTPINACGTCSTEPIGINNRGQVSGSYFDSDGNGHGFLKDGGAYITFDVPGAVFTEAGHINNKGQIACDYVNGDDGIDRPCIRNADGTLDLRDGYPGAAVTFAVGITESGLLIGSYTLDPNGSTGFTGYVLSGSRFVQTFSYPGSNVINTYSLDTNASGTIVGSFQTTKKEEHGFIRSANGTFQRVDYPGSVATELFGINSSGTIVGRYQDTKGVHHGFQLRGDRFLPIDYVDPKKDANTYVWGISDNEDIAGYSFPDDPSAGPYSGFEGSATTAVAGPKNIVTSQSQVQLDGSGSLGAGGKPLTWQWALAPGSPNAIITGGNGPNPIVQFFAGPGTYQFVLTVTDANGNAVTDTASATFEYRRN